MAASDSEDQIFRIRPSRWNSTTRHLPVRMFIVVVFPAPLCPRITEISSLYILRLTSLRAFKEEEQRLVVCVLAVIIAKLRDCGITEIPSVRRVSSSLGNSFDVYVSGYSTRGILSCLRVLAPLLESCAVGGRRNREDKRTASRNKSFGNSFTRVKVFAYTAAYLRVTSEFRLALVFQL